MKWKVLAVIAGTTGIQAFPALAHHTGAMFDESKTVALTGSVKEFQWTNPHCWIQLLVENPATDAAGTTEWSIQMAAPVQVHMGGWKPGTLKPGDRISVVVHPMRDGSHGGNFVSATAADGKPLGTLPKGDAK